MNIITRGDFDGLICSVLITDAESISQIRFAHPRAMQDGEVAVSGQDIIVNLPYHPDCGLWFDHHISEYERGSKPGSFKGKYGLAPSCARLVYDYYNKKEWGKYSELLTATDRIDSAHLSLDDILRPRGWLKIANTVDPRSGYAPSHDYFLSLVEWIKEYTVDEIVELDEVKDRLREFFKQDEEYKSALSGNSQLEGNVVTTDFRRLVKTPLGSRFLIYALYPSANVSLRVFNAPASGYVIVAVGRSLINKTCETDIGNLLAEYGGGGHTGAGTCRVMADSADDVIADLTQRLS